MNSTTLKLIALFTMLVDHIAEFIPGAPYWFHWIGRIAAPLFIYCMAWGLQYTHDRKKYLLRLYGWGVGMAVLDLISNNVIQDPYYPVLNNIFVTLLMTGVLVEIAERTRKNTGKRIKYWVLFALFQVVSTVMIAVFLKVEPFASLTGFPFFIGAILPNIIFNEGSFIFSLLGVLIYYARKSKKRVAITYLIFCAAYLALLVNTFLNEGISLTEGLLFWDYQWMMIAALPFMLAYNGEKGRGLKYFFYVFYPLHIMILYYAGNLFF